MTSSFQDSSWAHERRPLEASKPPGVGEVLLSHDGEALLEGLLTNFFVVRRAAGAADKASPETEPSGPTLERKPHLPKHETEERFGTRNGNGSTRVNGRSAVEERESAEGKGDGESEAESGDPAFRWRDDWRGLVVQTAALEDGVLPGVVRERVLR